MAKNIVICCDGTGNEYGEKNTNVVKLFRVIVKDHPQQVAYYDPGVGTFSMPAALSIPAKKITKLMGLAFGTGFTRNLENAYWHLMQTYEDGDRIWLFGFSRGAYTARALTGMLYKCGLLVKGNDPLIPYASKMYKYERNKRIAEGFKRTYSRAVKVHFLGIWDTVKSLGNIYNPLTLAYTMKNPDVKVVRHAVSIDEQRCFYRQNLWGPQLAGQDVRQVWFAGVHSDIGGSYPEKESGLSKIALKWMLYEAIKSGLLVNEPELRIVIPNAEVTTPADSRSKDAELFVPPDDNAMMHKSLKGGWWILEFIPKLYQDMAQKPPRRSLKIPRGEKRFIPEGSVIHESVTRRIENRTDYKPKNLPQSYEIELDKDMVFSCGFAAGEDK